MNIRCKKIIKITTMMVTYVAIISNIFAAKKTEINHLKFERTLKRSSSIHQNKIRFFNLDEQVYAKTLDNFADMRLLDQNNNNIPFVISKQTEKIVLNKLFFEKAKIISLNNDTKNNKVQLVIEAPNVAKLSAFKIVGNNENDFEKNIILYGSNDNKKYIFIDGGKKIYKHSNIANLHNNMIKLDNSDKKNAYRYYKLIIENVFETQQKIDYEVKSSNNNDIKQTTTRYNYTPFSISSVQLFFYKYAQIDKVVEYPISLKNRTEDLQKNYKENVTILDITTDRQPLKYLKLATSTKNYRRYYKLFSIIESVNKEELLTNLISGYISKSILNKDDVAINEIKIDNNKRYKKYRLVIYDENNISLKDITLKYYGYCYNAKFYTEGSTKLKLLYSCDDKELFQQFPCYDISNDLMAAPINNNINHYKLSKKEAKNSLFTTSEVKKNTKLPQWWIWIVIIGTAFLLILILIKVAKHDDDSFNNNDEEFPL